MIKSNGMGIWHTCGDEIYTQGLEGPRYNQKDNIKMAVKQIGSEGVDWINLAQYMEKCPAAVSIAVNELHKMRRIS